MIKRLYTLFLTNPVLNIRESNARDILALERTFLSWFRTSLAFIVVGIVIARMNILVPGKVMVNNIIGTMFSLMGLLIGLYCLYRYYTCLDLICVNNEFRPAKRFVFVLIGLMLIIVTSTIVLFYISV